MAKKIMRRILIYALLTLGILVWMFKGYVVRNGIPLAIAFYMRSFIFFALFVLPMVVIASLVFVLAPVSISRARRRRIYKNLASFCRALPYCLSGNFPQHVILFAVGFALLGTVSGLTGKYDKIGLGLEDELGQYLSISPKYGSRQNYRVGKSIAVDMNEDKIDGLQSRLPRKLKARAPSEVTTVMQIRRHNEKVGRYINSLTRVKTGVDAYRVVADVKVIDKATHSLIASSRFVEDPPEYDQTSPETLAGKQMEEIAEWLETLPRESSAQQARIDMQLPLVLKTALIDMHDVENGILVMLVLLFIILWFGGIWFGYCCQLFKRH